jgi:trimeric autotransporter adhesin
LSLTTGQYNTAVGLNSLSSTTTGNFNTAIGSAALGFNTANYNTAVGRNALFSNRFAEHNTAVGDITLYSNTAGDLNTAVGDSAMYRNTTGGSNTGVGESALHRNTEGDFNTAIGSSALSFNTTGFNNTAVGAGALVRNTTSSGNTALGRDAGVDVTMADNVICIGAPGANVNDSCYIGNVWQQPGGSQAVYVNASGKLGAQVSSRRFKDEIKPMEETSEVIYRLKPVSFRYKRKIDPTRPPGFGLIAEDVEKINPDLVLPDKEGKPYTVRYDAVNAMLLNEFLKEHRHLRELKSTVAKQEATIAELKSTAAQQQKGIEALTAGLQKVSDHLAGASPSLADLN